MPAVSSTRTRPRFSFVTDHAVRWAERYGSVVTALIAAGIEVEVIAAEHAEHAAVARLGVLSRSIPPLSVRGLSQAAIASVLVAHYSATEPDVVHSVSDGLHLSALHAARLTGVPGTLATVEGGVRPLGDRLPAWAPRTVTNMAAHALSALARWQVRNTDLVLVSDRETYDVLAAIDSDRVRLLDNGLGVDVEGQIIEGDGSREQRAAQDRLGISGRFMVGVALDPRWAPSDVDALFGIAAIARRRVPGMSVVVHGAHRLRGTARSRWERLSTGAVTVLDAETPRQIFMQAVDVLCQPDRTPGQPDAIQNAACVRVPCVAVDTGAHRAAVGSGDAGTLYPADDPNAAIDALRGYRDDRTRLSAAGAHARSRAMRLFDRDIAARAVLEAYDELLTPVEPLHLAPDGQLVPRSALDPGPTSAEADAASARVRKVRELLDSGDA